MASKYFLKLSADTVRLAELQAESIKDIYKSESQFRQGLFAPVPVEEENKPETKTVEELIREFSEDDPLDNPEEFIPEPTYDDGAPETPEDVLDEFADPDPIN